MVEVGGGTGVSALWLLGGMNDKGVLTSVDTEAEFQKQARALLDESGVDPNRVRLITGRAVEVLPRLTDGAYDMVLILSLIHI